MTAITLIAARDFRELWRDGRLLWAGGLIVVLLLTALAVGWQRQAALQAERVTAQALDYDDWLAQDARHPHDAAHQGMHVFKPEPPLSIVDPGIGPYVGSTLWLQTHRQSETKFRPAQDATGLQRFGTLSGAWVLEVLGPLLVIILGFNAFAGEREQGTLRQVMSLGVSARTLLAGKAVALASSIAILLLPAALSGAAAALYQSESSRLADTIARLSSLFLGYAAYVGIWVFVVLAVSARAPDFTHGADRFAGDLDHERRAPAPRYLRSIGCIVPSAFTNGVQPSARSRPRQNAGPRVERTVWCRQRLESGPPTQQVGRCPRGE